MHLLTFGLAVAAFTLAACDQRQNRDVRESGPDAVETAVTPEISKTTPTDGSHPGEVQDQPAI